MSNNQLSKLLDDSFESYYWLGFLLADGSFDTNKNRISLCVSVKDLIHLKVYAKFIGKDKIYLRTRKIFNGNFKQATVECCGNKIFPLIAKLLDIKSNKTYNPPSLKDLIIQDEKMFSLIVGFFDGDGTICNDSRWPETKKKRGNIIVHKAWLDNLSFMNTFILTYIKGKSNNIPKISTKDFAVWYINGRNLEYIKKKALELNLPIMERKWDKVTI